MKLHGGDYKGPFCLLHCLPRLHVSPLFACCCVSQTTHAEGEDGAGGAFGANSAVYTFSVYVVAYVCHHMCNVPVLFLPCVTDTYLMIPSLTLPRSSGLFCAAARSITTSMRKETELEVNMGRQIIQVRQTIAAGAFALAAVAFCAVLPGQLLPSYVLL